MNTLEIAILAIIQGIAEFLPVSSSGHLVVASAVLESMGNKPPAERLEVNIVLHVGTLLSVLLFYRRRIWRLVTTDRQVIPLLVLGTIPAVLLGLPLKKLAPGVLESPLLAGLMFPLTAVMLIWSSRHEPHDGSYTQLQIGPALLIGLFQAAAVLPGISRSGATIVGGLLVGLKREDAATYAFLLAIPAIAGAGVLELVDIVSAGNLATFLSGPLLFGLVLSAAVGVVSLWCLIRLVEKGHLHYFAYWLLPLGLVVTVWQISELLAR